MKKSSKAIRKTYNTYSIKLMWTAVRNFLIPIDYTRTKEIPTLLDLSDILNEPRKHLRILDISSPQLLSTTLAKMNPSWEVLYINPFKDELVDINFRIKTLNLRNIKTEQFDVKDKSLSRILGQFDYIFSLSVFEHIHPEKDGDIVAIKNIKRLLKPKGSFCISVPFYKKAFNEYIHSNAYHIENKEEGEIFFQRFYDKESLNNRIVISSELKKTNEIYVGERFYFKNRIDKRLGKVFVKTVTALLFGRLFRVISSIFLTTNIDSAKLSKPYLAFLKLTNDD